MRVKKIFGSILAGVLIVSGVGMSANAADIAPKNVEHRDHVIELSLERASGSFNMTVPAKSILRADKSFPLEAGETVTIKATYSPFSASVDFGLVDGNGKFHYLTVNNGTFDKTIEVPYTPYVSLTRTVNQTDHIVSYNANGESYGTDEAGAIAQIDLDLIRAVGTNGEQGYIRSSDYPELPKHLGDPLPSEQDLPLYTSDGITVIGVYHYGGGQVVESFD